MIVWSVGVWWLKDRLVVRCPLFDGLFVCCWVVVLGTDYGVLVDCLECVWLLVDMCYVLNFGVVVCWLMH